MSRYFDLHINDDCAFFAPDRPILLVAQNGVKSAFGLLQKLREAMAGSGNEKRLKSAADRGALTARPRLLSTQLVQRIFDISNAMYQVS
jgi:hypothetical protein